jgi:hypothetical protein
MIYDEHDDHMCLLRLRLWESTEPDFDQQCNLEQRVDGEWLECGLFNDVEAALTRAKECSALLHGQGIEKREQYRLLSLTARLPFSYFDVLAGELYPGTAPIAERSS